MIFKVDNFFEEYNDEDAFSLGLIRLAEKLGHKELLENLEPMYP